MEKEPIIIQTDLESLNDYSLQLSRWSLKLLGAWPISFYHTKYDRIISFATIIVCYYFFLLSTIPSLLYVLFDDEGDIDNKLKALGPLTHCFISCFNYTTLLLRGREIRWCIEQMQSDWQAVTRIKELEIMVKNAKFGRYVTVLCVCFLQSGVFCYCTLKGFTTYTVQIGNETKTVRSLPYEVHRKLIPVDNSPVYEIVFTLQSMTIVILGSATLSAFSLAAMFAAHALGQLNILAMWITELVNDTKEPNESVYLNEIGLIVEFHSKTLSFISTIEEIIYRICSAELYRSTFGICFLFYYFLTEWEEHDFQNLTSYVILLISIGFNTFILCYIGEILTEQCKKIGDVVYMTNWYYLNNRSVIDLTLIIARSSVVINITAGKLIRMSINTFGNVFKSGFAYLNILRQII